MGEIVVDNAVYRLSISLSSPEIFSVKVESCRKTYWILDVFALPNFKGAVPPKTCPRIITPAIIRLRPLTPKILRAIHWILNQFLIPLWKNYRGTPIPGGGCTSKSWSCSSACKNLGTQHPVGAEIWYPEKVDLSGYDSTLRSPEVVNQSSPHFFRLTGKESQSIKYVTIFEYNNSSGRSAILLLALENC